MENIKERINELNSLDNSDIERITDEIKNITEQSEKLELYNEFTKKAKEILMASSLTEEEIKNKISYIKEKLEDGLFRLEIDRIFSENEFNVETIMNNNTEEREIDKIISSISELEAELGHYESTEKIDEEILKQEEEKKHNEELISEQKKDLISEKIGEKSIDSLEQEIKELKNKRDLLFPEVITYGRKKDELDKIKNLIKVKEEEIKTIKELSKQVKLLEEKISNLKKEDFIEAAKEKLKNMNLRGPHAETYMNKNLENIANDLYKIEKQHLTKELKKLINQKEISKLEERKKNLDKKDFIEKAKEIAKTMNLRGQLPDKYIENIAIRLCTDEKKKIEQEIEELKSGKKSPIEKLEKEQQKLDSKVNKKINNLKKLKLMTEVKEAYNKIIEEAMQRFESKNVDLKAIEDFIKNHEKLSILDKYKNSDKLKNELKEDILNNLKKKKITKQENNKKLWMKSLAAAAGFATGLGLSAVPGVGTIRMGLATAKLATSAINLWTKKFPEGHVARIKGNLNKKAKEKYPDLIAKIEKMKEKLNNPYANWFINGVSAGYITGNIIEIFSGKSIFEHFAKENPPSQELVDATKPTNKPTPPTGKPTITTEVKLPEIVPSHTVSDIILNPGEVVDLSNITQGLVSSDSNNLVNLITSAGKEVMFDKAVTLPDGRIMWHFKQLNGLGYAWFDSKTVQEVLAKAAEVSSKTL